MKNTTKYLVYLMIAAACVTGCTNKDKENAKHEVNKAADTTKKAGEDVKDKVSDSIDNVMTYFNKEGLKIENSKAIKNMDFAAHEGRSFDVNGKTAYLYRVNSDDEGMKKVIKEAKENGKVKVNIDHKEQLYGAKVNGDFLLLYDTSADMGNVLNTFPNYQASGVNNPENTQNSTNNANDGTNDTNVEPKNE